MNKTPFLPTIVISVGLFLLLLGAVWPTVVQPSWSEEEGQEHGEASAALHAAAHDRNPSHALSHGDGQPSQSDTAKVKAAKEEAYEKALKKFDEGEAAKASSEWIQSGPAGIFRWGGTFVLVLGIGLYGFHRFAE